MNSETKLHFNNLLKALVIEKQEELEQYKMLTNGADYSQRIEEGITLYPVEYIGLTYNDFGDQIIEFKTNPKQEGYAFKTGKTIEIFNAEGEHSIGQISYFRENELLIKSADENLEDWIKNGKIGINSLVDTKTYDAYEKSLNQILLAEKNILPVQFFEKITRFAVKKEFESKQLNDSQNQAVNEILSENPFSIIHGPPGTGKTTTLVAAVNKLASLNKSILICAPSNAAVDNISIKLLADKINVVRLGNESKIDESVKPAYLESKIKNDSSFKFLQKLKNQSDDIRKKAFKYKRSFGKEEFLERKQLKQELKALRNDIRNIQQDITKTILQNAQVICGTFYTIQQYKLPSDKYDYLIIDEAGQAIEPAIWSVSHLGQKMVLAGDDLQLPPTVKSQEAEKLGLAKSILEKAAEIDYPRTLLNVQYRMNAKIMAFSNQQFYDNKLQAADFVSDWKIDNNLHEPVEFIDTAGCGFEESKLENGGGISNLGEVAILQKVIGEYNYSNSEGFKAEDLGKNSIAIITPYRSQLNEIQAEIQRIDSNTVDSFQGQERDIIIISLVRNNEIGEIGFLKDYRRMNVAMTRARKKLVVIGDSATVGQDKFYADFLEYVEKEGSYRTAWEFM